MTTIRKEYLHAAYPLTLPQDRFFSLSWDNSKVKRADGDKLRTQETRGVKWADGFISLNNGLVFESQGEMEIQLKLAGNFKVTFEDEI